VAFGRAEVAFWPKCKRHSARQRSAVEASAKALAASDASVNALELQLEALRWNASEAVLQLHLEAEASAKALEACNPHP